MMIRETNEAGSKLNIFSVVDEKKRQGLTLTGLHYNMGGIIFFVLSDLHLNDILILRKPHPCGGTEWKVTRLGADIGLQCLTCGRQMLLPRHELSRRLKKIHARGTDESGKS